MGQWDAAMLRDREIRPLRLIACLALGLVLGACSARPFKVEQPRSVATVVASKQKTTVELGPHDYDPNPRAISLCYSAQWNTLKQVIERAESLCPNGGVIEYYDEDFLLNRCGLLQPMRVTFICTPGPQPPSPYY